MIKMLTFTEKGVCEKIANMFELAAEDHWYPIIFIEKWLISETNEALIELCFKEIAQSPRYQLNSFYDELRENNIVLDKAKYCDKTAMYWMGYTLTYWCFLRNIKPEELLRNYSMLDIYARFETLHSLSIERAIEEIENNINTSFYYFSN